MSKELADHRRKVEYEACVRAINTEMERKMSNQTINDGGPAFPVPDDGYWADPQTCKQWVPYNGMSLRDYFAAKASDDDVAAVLVGFVRDRQATSEERANARYIHADNMIAARGMKS